jgi:hypothetical protein
MKNILNNKIDEKRKRIIKGVNDRAIRTIQNKVALILEKNVKTRGCDIALQLKYWEEYCEDTYNGNDINPGDLYSLPRLTSLVRARAFIQNTLGLYQATEKVKATRIGNKKEQHNYYEKNKNLTKRGERH